MFQYSCGRCGNKVEKTARVCLHCGAKLGNIHCKHCGYIGIEADFIDDRCPHCNAVVRTTPVRYERCKECGKKIEAGQWTCPSCGHTQWGIILGLAAAAVICILLAVVVLPLPTIWTLLVGGLGIALFYSAFYGIGGALHWRALTTFGTTTLLFVMIATTSLAARYRYSPNAEIIETPAAVVAAAAIDQMPEPTATPAPTFTPVPTATPQILAMVNVPLANVRQSAGVDFEVVCAIAQDESVVLLGRNADKTWVKVKTQKDFTGWVFAQLLKLPAEADDLPETQ